MWVVCWRGWFGGAWNYAVFTSKKEAKRHQAWLLDSDSADSTIGPRRFVPKNATPKGDKKAGGSP